VYLRRREGGPGVSDQPTMQSLDATAREINAVGWRLRCLMQQPIRCRACGAEFADYHYRELSPARLNPADLAHEAVGEWSCPECGEVLETG